MNIKEMRIRGFEESQAQSLKVGSSVKYMCLSLACEYHSDLHGELFDADEIRNIYGTDDVQEDCKCAIIPILVDPQGNPVIPRQVEKAKAQKLTKSQGQVP